MNKKIAITLGDFNGIGPEITVKALNKIKPNPTDIVIIGSSQLLTGLHDKYEIIEIPFSSNNHDYGKETKFAGEFSYLCLKKACDMAKAGALKAIVTAPVSKNAMHLAGHNYSGQTEVLEKNLSNPENDEKAEMLFVANDFRVMLLTRHVALKDVKIKKSLLIEKINRINRVLKQDFKIQSPRIALCSLNPHAGENGLLGSEETDEMLPAVNELRKNAIDLTDPKPADTLFVGASKAYLNKQKQPYDCYCACYHDQGLIPIKALAMEKAVNMTVGLSIIRTSPAHGTAYDIAGKNIASESSMVEALKQCLSVKQIFRP